jgi:hypothetical protein
MGNRTDDDTAATGRLTTLLAHFLQHPVTGPAERSPASAVPGTPLNLRVHDHIQAAVREVVDDTLAVNPHPSPLPERVEAVYEWYVANTANAEQAQRQRRDTILYRQSLEHAIAMGDVKVVRPHRCPACRCLGLMWRAELQAAVCTNGNCLTKDGRSRRFALARLAYEHVAAKFEKSVRDCAT